MIDLHTHILPGIDDGPDDLEEAVAMCRAAAEDGCSVLVATPHQRHPHWWNDDLAHIERLRRALQSQLGPHPKILLGGEVRADGGILNAVDALDTSPRIQTLANSRYILLEFGPQAGPDPESVVHEMTVAGWTPVLAHPECIPWLAHDLERLDNLIDLGALLQITAMSVIGEFGHGPRDSAWRLLQEDMVHVLASDCHGSHHRPPGLSTAAAAISKKFGNDRSHALTTENPRAIIDNRRVEVAA